MQVIKQDQVQEKIITIRNQKVIVDTDVAQLYGVETKRVNEAVKNNPEKFPNGYLFELNKQEKDELVENFDRFKKLKHSSVPLKVFTEKGLYMLATILKSPEALETTLAIIDTFAKVRELGRAVNQIQSLPENSPNQKTLIEHTGDLIADLMIPENELAVTGTETTYEMNFAIFKIKRTIKKGK
ncbi:MAG: DNA-binding protein [Gammaproteobacteria bacterium RIFCSPHIGHO2_12_FULL_37_14]|nr:MAG: DNA-binding protein [Gammaproteobacteria bacterium RIFCSPHIGHO2_12_FULL_37_14]